MGATTPGSGLGGLAAIPDGDNLSMAATFRVAVIGSSEKVRLPNYLTAIDNELRKTTRNYMGMQMGDVLAT